MSSFFTMNYFLCGIAQLFSHIILGCTGFGGTVVAAPFTQKFLGISIAIPFGNLVTFPVLIVILAKEYKKIDWKNLIIIVAVMCLGLPIGQALFLQMSANVAKVCIGLIVTIVALLGVYKMFVKIPRLEKSGVEVDENKPDTMANKIIRYGCLFLGGIVHGAFVIGGPLVTVYTIAAVKEKSKFRATMTMVWMIINTLNTINAYRTDQLVPGVWKALVLGIPTFVGLNMFIRAALTFI